MRRMRVDTLSTDYGVGSSLDCLPYLKRHTDSSTRTICPRHWDCSTLVRLFHREKSLWETKLSRQMIVHDDDKNTVQN